MGFGGAVPRKCSQCPKLFEGECTRNYEDYPEQVLQWGGRVVVLGTYRHLDHGPCPFPGETDPVPFEIPVQPAPSSRPAKTVQVPRKCSGCPYLKGLPIHDAVCTYEPEVWGLFHRGLDWGGWLPSEEQLGQRRTPHCT
jgi:hypothetical protein